MSRSGDDLHLRIGRDELVLRQRYELLSILNDVLMALWFVIGSILFFWESTTYAGTWFFLVGSLQFLARPAIRLARKIHLQRRHGSPLDSGAEY
ncbi:YrhK family protein [uncultured Pseudokineococcus sp.]|uniref:YrhK family protein n=1 Tax=uncultured Pseudokineococcus sp. TaxID=1642928 RepID=UPI002610182D|nr:YrhK family protein [uncultured Pseudokineococcus sp.]